MRSRTTFLGLFTVVAALAAPVQPASARVTTSPNVTITSAPHEAVEGDRISFAVKVSNASKATRVQLQERVADVFGDYGWVGVRSQKVHGQSRHTFTVTADGPNTERYRAVVTYGHGRKDVSGSVSVKVWRWIPLTYFDAYYVTNGVYDYEGLQFDMDGKAYLGWKASGSYGYWESRYTPGRNCRAFRADLGVQDSSQDGSTANISFLTDDGTPLYTSGTLTPGMVEPVEIEMNLPYRFWVQATDTSPDGLSPYPAMGDPAFLCTGI